MRNLTPIRFNCDCGKMAVTVILVTVGDDENRATLRLPLCKACLKEEEETQALLDELRLA